MIIGMPDIFPNTIWLHIPIYSKVKTVTFKTN